MKASRRTLLVASAALALATIAAPPLLAASYEGEVIQVQERVRTANGGERDELRIRTREGEELRLHLGAAGACAGCVQVGDQVRIRTTRRTSEGEALQVRRMAVRRTGQEHAFCDRSGRPIATESRASAWRGAGDRGAGDQDRLRDRDRIHDPGSGRAGAGGGPRAGGGGGGQG